jgi:hypothetical protein
VASETVPADATIDVDVPGFFPRRTRLSSVPATNLVTLWPVAGETEAEAIRSIAFHRGWGSGEFFVWRHTWPAYYLALLTAGDPRTPSEISARVDKRVQQHRRADGASSQHRVFTRAGQEEEVVVLFDRHLAFLLWAFRSVLVMQR